MLTGFMCCEISHVFILLFFLEYSLRRLSPYSFRLQICSANGKIRPAQRVSESRCRTPQLLLLISFTEKISLIGKLSP